MHSTIPPESATSRRLIPAVLFLALLAPGIVASWPLQALEIREFTPGTRGGAVVAHIPMLLGISVTTSIIHSVQLTPVIDEYRVQEGRIWSWREKIMSHNAGLPSLKPERGRFIMDPPWMIVEGTGQSWERFVYRVGTETLGRNELCVSPHPCRELWRELPGKRIAFEIVFPRLRLWPFF